MQINKQEHTYSYTDLEPRENHVMKPFECVNTDTMIMPCSLVDRYRYSEGDLSIFSPDISKKQIFLLSTIQTSNFTSSC
jgi:hypothetical protein